MNAPNMETPKYRVLTRPHLVGNGVDIGSGGEPVVPWAIQVDLPADQFKRYNQREIPETIQWMGDIFNLPFKDETLDWVYSSHLIEDFNREIEWARLFAEWTRCLKHGGKLVLIVPDFTLWNDAIRRGQPPNCSHWAPEPSLGDMSTAARRAGLRVVEERMTAIYAGDYSILGVFQKP